MKGSSLELVMVSLNPADLPPRVVDERGANRKRILLSGKVVYGEGNFAHDCTIRNLSETGARITLPKGECVPTRVFLIDKRTATAYEAAVTWIKAPDFGLQFHQVFHLEGQIPDKLQFLKRVWSECHSPLGSNV